MISQARAVRRLGLVTGSEPFAGLTDSPSIALLEEVQHSDDAGLRLVTVALPVSHRQLPAMIDELVQKYRPDFVLSLGLALGSPVLRLETVAINRADFAVMDNEGALPQGEVLDQNGPDARFATWDARGIVQMLLKEGLPAVVSYHAGTHLCNLTLFGFLRSLQSVGLASPCGFLHLPYLPAQVSRFLLDGSIRGDVAPRTSRDLPSMSYGLQRKAMGIVIQALAAAPLTLPSSPP